MGEPEEKYRRRISLLKIAESHEFGRKELLGILGQEGGLDRIAKQIRNVRNNHSKRFRGLARVLTAFCQESEDIARLLIPGLQEKYAVLYKELEEDGFKKPKKKKKKA